MRYAIISDVHANTDALDRVLADAATQGVERIVCLGDVVGYGPQPAEAVKRVRERCAITLAGNHDDAVSGRGDADAFIDLAGDAVARHRDALAPDDLAWLKALPWSYKLEGAVAAHGDVCEPQKFYYVENADDATANFNATDAQLLFVGHTHVPVIFLTGRSGAVYRVAPQDFTLEDGKRYIVNPGSVGYPRETDGRCLSSYVVYDSTERTVSFRFLPFSVASVMQRGKSPRRIRTRVLAAGALAIGLLCAGLAWVLAPTTEVTVNEITVAEDPALVLARKTLAPLAGCKCLRANLVLARGSAPVKLTIVTRDAADRPLATDTITVKASSKKEIKLPPGAARAELTAAKFTPDAAVAIKSFAPAASTE